jgi:protein required for attachment to host cells
MPTWILVADEVRARLLEAAREDAPLVERGDLGPAVSGAAARHRARDGAADPGDVAPQSREGSDPQRALASRRFAYEIAAVLDEGRAHGRYARLLLVAPPRFLGTLRAALPEGVQVRISATLATDRLGEDLGTLRERLRGYL